MYLLGTAIMIAWGIPLFLVVNTGSAALIVLAFVVSYAVCQNSLAGVQGAWFSELFTAKTRTTGASLAYQFSAVVSGFTPLVATALYASTGWIGPARAVQRLRPAGPGRRAGHPGDLGPCRARGGRSARAGPRGGGRPSPPRASAPSRPVGS